MRYLDSFLITEEAPNGIVSFELAKELVRSRSIISTWNATARSAAGLSLGLDFIFLLIYISFIAVVIEALNKRLWQDYSFFKTGKIFLVAIFSAAIFDFIS